MVSKMTGFNVSVCKSQEETVNRGRIWNNTLLLIHLLSARGTAWSVQRLIAVAGFNVSGKRKLNP